MNFSDKIKYQREQNHLTQKELAELVGVSQRAIAAYESSGTIARISTMRKLAHALNVSYDYLKHDEITDPSLKALISLNRNRNQSISNSIDRTADKKEVIYSLKKELKGFLKTRE